MAATPLRIGYWVNTRWSAHLSSLGLAEQCARSGLTLVPLDLDVALETQGPFAAIFHILLDVLVKERLDPKAAQQLDNFEKYVAKHPQMVLLDPLDKVRQLLDRSRQYQILTDSQLTKHNAGLFAPAFVKLTSSDVKESLRQMAAAQVSFPIVCKPLLAHGVDLSAHKMCLIFGESGLSSLPVLPCVAQQFHPHNGRLFKVYVLGEDYFVCQRPSLTNHQSDTNNQETVHFDSRQVSKRASENVPLSFQGDSDGGPLLDESRLESLVSLMRHQVGLSLFGLDLIVDCTTGRYGIIDLNYFPSFHDVPNFSKLFCDLVMKRIEKQRGNDF